MTTEPEDDAPDLSPEQAARFWGLQLELSERQHADWVKRGEEIEKRYRAEKDAAGKLSKSGRRMAILYSNTETLKSALYARTPKPDVRRRFADRNPVARLAAEIIERSLIYCSDRTEHDRAYRRGVQDRCLPGRGVVWIDYEPDIRTVPVPDPMTGQPAIGPDGEPITQEVIADQKVEECYVYWQDFRHAPARCWQDVWWVGRRHRMTREDLTENKFEDADRVPLNWQPDMSDKDKSREVPEDLKRAEVWEIWDKSREKRFWVVRGHPKALRVDDDPYALEGFWPLAEPLFATLGNDTLTPTPDFEQYRDQAEDLDEITARISQLTKALKRRGVYDASIEALKRLARAGDNEFIPVPGDKYGLMVQTGGLKNAFQVEDISIMAQVLMELYKQRDQLIQSIYEITGISDIMRGASNANETATAQNIKAQFGSMRMKDSQREVQRWVRDTYRIKAEIICEHFEPQVLAEMTGLGQDPSFMQAIELLRQDKARAYQVDIETDSTVFEDAEQEKQARVELLTAMGQFAQQWMPVVQAAPEMMGLVGEMLSFGARGFKAGRQLEDKIDETVQAIIQRMSQPQQQQPDPAIVKVQAEMKRDEQSHQMDMQSKQIDQQGKILDFQVKQATAQTDMQRDQQRAQIEAMNPARRVVN